MKRGGFHQADHVGRGINWRQLRVVSGQSEFEFDRLFGGGAGAEGDRFGHKSESRLDKTRRCKKIFQIKAGRRSTDQRPRLSIFADYAAIFAVDRKSTRLNSSHIPLSRMP